MLETTDVRPVEGYEPEIGLLLASLEDGRREWLGEMGDVDERALVQRPFPGGPSIGAEILHIAWVEAAWIARSVGGRALSEEFQRRTRADETDVDAARWPDAPQMPLADYLALLEEVRGTTREVLRAERDPARAIQSDPQWQPDTVRWIVSHVVQHEAYHGGQAVLVKRMVTG